MAGLATLLVTAHGLPGALASGLGSRGSGLGARASPVERHWPACDDVSTSPVSSLHSPNLPFIYNIETNSDWILDSVSTFDNVWVGFF